MDGKQSDLYFFFFIISFLNMQLVFFWRSSPSPLLCTLPFCLALDLWRRSFLNIPLIMSVSLLFQIPVVFCFVDETIFSFWFQVKVIPQT